MLAMNTFNINKCKAIVTYFHNSRQNALGPLPSDSTQHQYASDPDPDPYSGQVCSHPLKRPEFIVSAPCLRRSSVTHPINDPLMSWQIKSPRPHTQTAMKVRSRGWSAVQTYEVMGKFKPVHIYSFSWAFGKRRASWGDFNDVINPGSDCLFFNLRTEVRIR